MEHYGQHGLRSDPASVTDTLLQPAIQLDEPVRTVHQPICAKHQPIHVKFVLQPAPSVGTDTSPSSAERASPAVRVKRRAWRIRRLRMGHRIRATVRSIHISWMTNSTVVYAPVLCRCWEAWTWPVPLALPFTAQVAQRTNLATPDTRRMRYSRHDVQTSLPNRHGTAFYH